MLGLIEKIFFVIYFDAILLSITVWLCVLMHAHCCTDMYRCCLHVGGYYCIFTVTLVKGPSICFLVTAEKTPGLHLSFSGLLKTVVLL